MREIDRASERVGERTVAHLKELFCGTHLRFVVEPPVVGDRAHAAGPQHGCEVDGFVLDHHRRSQELHHLELTCSSKSEERRRALFQKQMGFSREERTQRLRGVVCTA